MTMQEEAKSIRDKIYNTLPDAVKEAFGDDIWAASMYGARGYFQTCDDEKVYVDDLVTLFRKNYTVTYMYYYLEKRVSIKEIIQILRESCIPMTDYPMLNYRMLSEYLLCKSASGIPDDVLKEIDSYVHENGHSIGKQITTDGSIYEKDKAAIHAMLQDGYSVVDVARHCHRDIRAIAIEGNVFENPTMLVAAVMWTRGCSLELISAVLDVHRTTLLHYLYNMNCATFEDRKDDYNVHMVNDSSNGVQVGAMTKVSSSGIPEQVILNQIPSKHEAKVALELVKDLPRESRVEKFMVLFGVTKSVAERLV